MDPCCRHLKELLSVETNIIKKHIDDHKWFNQIPDQETAIHDFIKRYGWIMRELYCGHACVHRHNCEIGLEFIPEDDEI